MELPVYRLKIREDDNSKIAVDYIALVDQPAILTDWVAFSKTRQRFQTLNPEKQMLIGAFMIADMPIYRSDARGEYYVLFDKSEIEKIVQKFFRNGFQSNFNIMHDPNAKVEGVYLMESFITNKELGISNPKGFEDIAEGSWFGVVKVDNKEIWDNYIKTGQLKGFSIEGFFDYEYIQDEEQAVLEAIVAALV